MKIELDHMRPRAEGGSDDIENAIALCFDCHAEIHSYNDQHPRGRKFRPDELRKHKEEWLRICREESEALIADTRSATVGPLQSLIDEIEFNETMAKPFERKDGGPLRPVFHVAEFDRAVSLGCISVLKDSLRNAIMEAYSAVHCCNEIARANLMQSNRDRISGNVTDAFFYCTSRRKEKAPIGSRRTNEISVARRRRIRFAARISPCSAFSASTVVGKPKFNN